MSDAIVRGARIIARNRGILPPVGTRAARLDVDRFAAADWPKLEAAGAIGHLRVRNRDAAAKLGEVGAAADARGNPRAAPDAVFIDFYVALLTPAGIGVNILGKPWYDQYTTGRDVDDQLMLLAAKGSYSFLGDGWEQRDVLDRVEIVQGNRTIRLPTKMIKTLPFVHADNAPALTEQALVFLPGRGAFDPTRPFQADLLVTGATAAGRSSFASFSLPYRVPDAYLVPAAAAPEAAEEGREGATTVDWRAIWRGHPVKIAVLAAGLATLTAILFLQNVVTRRPRLHRWIRIGFLSWTLVWLGWYAGAQLTVVNLIAYLHALLTDRRWDFVLVDPLIAILSVFTLAGLFLWGRAVFCGWLCPFGALQELVGMAAQRLRVRQIGIPAALHERLTAVKYLMFLGLCRGLVLVLGSGHERGRGGALQGGHHPAVHDRMADGRLGAGADRGQRLRRTVLLPVHLPARRRPLDIRPGAHVQLAEAAPGVRHPLPDLRDRMPGRARSSAAARST